MSVYKKCLISYNSSLLLDRSLIPPLFALWQSLSQAWMKEEGDANGISYHTVLLNSN